MISVFHEYLTYLPFLNLKPSRSYKDFCLSSLYLMKLLHRDLCSHFMRNDNSESFYTAFCTRGSNKKHAISMTIQFNISIQYTCTAAVLLAIWSITIKIGTGYGLKKRLKRRNCIWIIGPSKIDMYKHCLLHLSILFPKFIPL